MRKISVGHVATVPTALTSLRRIRLSLICATVSLGDGSGDWAQTANNITVQLSCHMLVTLRSGPEQSMFRSFLV